MEGAVVILDLMSEDYFILNATATEVWQALVAHDGDADAVVQAMMARFPPEHGADVVADVERVIAEWEGQGLLQSGPQPMADQARSRAAPSSARRLLGVSAGWSMAWTTASLRWKGFGRTYLDCVSLPQPRRSADVGDRLCAAEAAFLRAENLVGFASAPRDCLPRSLALFRFCRSIGLPVGHRIGGRRFPQFLMHAWVECDGRVVLDDPACREYTILASIAP
jgi:hypothetical protein